MAEKKLLQLTISRVNGAVFDSEVIAVSVPGTLGEMQLLAGHEALISPLKKGEIVVTRSDDTTESFSIETGTLEVSNNHATILI